MHKVVDFFTSLRLTVACLLLALGLVFFGTIAQAQLGLYIAQERFFQSLVVWWGPDNAAWKIPVWPGGYLLGTLLLLNLIAAHIKRFTISRKKIGIFTIHAGLILLLVGQFFTELMQVESFMNIPVGGSKNYSENSRKNELAIVDVTDPKTDNVVAIPESLLAKSKEIKDPQLPFTLKVNRYYLNSNAFPADADKAPSLKQAGLAFAEKSRAISMNDRDVPLAEIEVVADSGSLGTHLVSNWFVERNLLAHLAKRYGAAFHPETAVQPRTFSHKGRTYQIAMRPVRYYKPFTMTLLKFTHARYMGTDVPKDFSSRIRIVNPESKENRETLIYMNNPLRYGGETYYQGSFEEGDGASILQVVRNPNWRTPYIACTLVAAGLLIQFLSHLLAFSKKKRTV